jgi:hypothetical protein
MTRAVGVGYATGRTRIATGTLGKDARKVRWKTLPHRPMPTIDRSGTGPGSTRALTRARP